MVREYICELLWFRYVSFGGLLMKLEAQRSDVDEAIRLDDRLYLLMRKVY